jgi:hypothetical protein
MTKSQLIRLSLPYYYRSGSDEELFEDAPELLEKKLGHLPHGIARDGLYLHRIEKRAWAVLRGTAYREDFEQHMYELGESRYRSMGPENVERLKAIMVTIPRGKDRNVLRRILLREMGYWDQQNTLRDIRLNTKAVILQMHKADAQ